MRLRDKYLEASSEDNVYFYLVFFNILQEVSSFHLGELISQGNSVLLLAVTYTLIYVSKVTIDFKNTTDLPRSIKSTNSS